MSIFRKILKGAAKLASFVPGPIGAIAKVGGTIAASAAAVRAGTQVVRASSQVIPGVGRVIASGGVRRIAGRVLAGAGTVATGAAIYDAAGNFLGNQKKRRGINPMNMKAAKRALRRIERAKKLMSRLGHITIRKEKC